MPKEVARYNNCFVCGPDNPIGLNLEFLTENGLTWTEFTADTKYEGYKGILHGGIIATILDEVMIKAAIAQDIVCVTAGMEIRFKAPAEIKSKFRCEARVLSVKGRLIETEGFMRDESGKVIAEATGKFLTVSKHFDEKLRESL